MEKLAELIRRCISENAISHRAQFAKKWGLKNHVFFWENVLHCMTAEIESRMLAGSSGSGLSLGFAFGRPPLHGGQSNTRPYMDSSIARIKATHEVVNELKGDLSRDHGELTYEYDFETTYNFDNWFLGELQKDDYFNPEWCLQETYGEINYWCWEKFKRVYGKKIIYRLIHNDGTQMIFELPEAKGDNLHCFLFKVLPENQGSYFLMLKRFKYLFNFLCERRNMKAIQSPCLGGAMPETEIRNYGKPDWRFEKKNLGGSNSDAFGLLSLWLKIGAVRPKLIDDNKDNLLFFSTKQVMKIKKEMTEQNGENPYAHISRSIYGRELSKKLKEDM
jgi:hypothetical protein